MKCGLVWEFRFKPNKRTMNNWTSHNRCLKLICLKADPRGPSMCRGNKFKVVKCVNFFKVQMFTTQFWMFEHVYSFFYLFKYRVQLYFGRRFSVVYVNLRPLNKNKPWCREQGKVTYENGYCTTTVGISLIQGTYCKINEYIVIYTKILCSSKYFLCENVPIY